MCIISVCVHSAQQEENMRQAEALLKKAAAKKSEQKPATSELIAYRCWNIRTFRTSDPTLVEVGGQLAIPYSLVLTSLNDTPWPGPVMHADEKPTRHNFNGIYALKTPAAAYSYSRSADVTGEIAIYGKIQEFEEGYRAQHAAIRRLTLHAYRITESLPPENIARNIAATAHVLERRYQCEVLIDTAKKSMTTMEELLYKIKQGNITPADLAGIAKIFGV
jgi:hypothetical protein